MHYRISFIFVTFIGLFCFAATGFTQNTNTDEDSKPVILYSGTPKKYEIADIKVEGVKNYEDYVLIGLSGLSVGQTITVPGDEITGDRRQQDLVKNQSDTTSPYCGCTLSWCEEVRTYRP